MFLRCSGWYYHKEYKAWLTRAPNTEPVQKTDRCEAASPCVAVRCAGDACVADRDTLLAWVC